MVTVLFADVVGFTRLSETVDPETVTGILNRLFGRYRVLVERFEGRVDKFIGDAAMVLFGAPVAHEDDAERAVLTALDMLRVLPEIREQVRRELGVDYPLDVHIGIATGLVVAGQVGAGEGSGYTVMGDAVNLAARLNDMARGGEILMAGSTWRLVRGRILADEVQTIRVKGKEESVRVYRARGVNASGDDARGLGAFESPLVGREPERARLSGTLGALASGRGALVMVEGPAGVGKSRLVRELLRDPAVDALVHPGRCISWGRIVPYFPWGQLLAGMDARRLLADDPDGQALLDQVITGELASRQDEQAETHRARVFAAVTEAVRRAAQERPRVLVLEDMHWSDPTSLDLLAHILPLLAGSPLLVAVVYRPGVGSRPEYVAERSPAEVVRLALEPLAYEQVQRLVANLVAGVECFPPALADDIAKRSQGVPLFAEELLRSYVDAGYITPAGAGWCWEAERAGAALQEVPTSLHALLSARVDRLSDAARVRLQVASVIGQDFDPAMVDALLHATAGDPAWDALERTGEIRRGAGGRVRFCNALLQEVLYATLLKSRRQELHAAVGEHLAADTQRRNAQLHALAWHFEQAGKVERAAGFWRDAAAQASSVFANDEALDLWQRVAALVPATPAAFDAQYDRGMLLDRIGRSAEAAAALDALAETLHLHGERARLARVLAARTTVAYHLGDGAGMTRYAERALEEARASGDLKLEAIALKQVGMAHEFACRYAEAVSHYERAVDRMGGEGDSNLLVGTYISLGEIARATGDYAAALEWYERAEAVFARLHPGRMNITCTNNRGAALVELGEHARGMECLDACLHEFERTGYWSQAAETYYLRGLGHLRAGDTEAAALDAASSLRLARENREKEMEGLALRLCGVIARHNGATHHAELPRDGRACLEESITLFAAAGKPAEEARSRVELARLFAAAGDRASATAQWAEAERLYSSLGIARLAAAVRSESSPTQTEG